ncbi:unnamed protein product, partial [Clonostachys rhizophaga]
TLFRFVDPKQEKQWGKKTQTIVSTLPFMKEISGMKCYRIIGPLPAEHESKRTNIEAMEVAHVTVYNGPAFHRRPRIQIYRFEHNTQLISDHSEAAQGFQEVVTFPQDHFQKPHIFSYVLRVSKLPLWVVFKDTANSSHI